MDFVVGQAAGHQLADVMEELLIAQLIPPMEEARAFMAARAREASGTRRAALTVWACRASMVVARAGVELAELNLSRAKAEAARCREGEGIGAQ